MIKRAARNSVSVSELCTCVSEIDTTSGHIPGRRPLRVPLTLSEYLVRFSRCSLTVLSVVSSVNMAARSV